MKKSDQKNRDRKVKNEGRQARHERKRRLLLQKRADRHRHHIEKIARRVAPADVDARDERIREQLERNMEILAALEREHDEEAAAKASLNRELEAQGILTLEDKVKHLQEAGVGGSADVHVQTE